MLPATHPVGSMTEPIMDFKCPTPYGVECPRNKRAWMKHCSRLRVQSGWTRHSTLLLNATPESPMVVVTPALFRHGRDVKRDREIRSLNCPPLEFEEDVKFLTGGLMLRDKMMAEHRKGHREMISMKLRKERERQMEILTSQKIWWGFGVEGSEHQDRAEATNCFPKQPYEDSMPEGKVMRKEKKMCDPEVEARWSEQSEQGFED